MRHDLLSTWTRRLGLLLGIGYLAGGIGGWIGDVTDGDGGELAFWLIFLVGGGVLLLASLLVDSLPRGVALVLGIVGALAGALALFWTIVVPLLASALVVMLVTRFRGGGAAATT